MRRFAFALVTALLVAACGGSASPSTTATTSTSPPTTTEAATDAPTTTSASTTAATTTTSTTAVPDGFPVTLTHSTGEVTLERRPEAIISLSPTATEILFAIEAASQVIAVDKDSNYPETAPVTNIDAIAPNVEAIAALNPDLVVLGFDPGDIESGLTALGIPAIVQFAGITLDDTYTQIEQLGDATGHAAAAAELVDNMQASIDDLQARAGEREEPLTYYHELDATLYSVTSTTFIGELYSIMGLENVADAADDEGFGYPQLSAEFILDVDPDIIFLADTKCCGQSASTLAERPGWDQLTALQAGSVVELDDDIASRWGPRVVEFLEAVATAIETYDAGETD